MQIGSYDLDLDVDFGNSQVDGTVTLSLTDSENPLVLDAVDLEVTGVRVNGDPWRSRIDKKRGKLIIPRVPRQEAKVEVSYTKQVREGTIFGLYKSKYGKDYMLVTDLEPAEARTVFPCKDEPSYKSVFKLRVVTDDGLKVISNCAQKSISQTADGRVSHVFEPSPKMSTYLFFLGVGSFEEVKVASGKTEVIAASRPGSSQNASFILGVSARALKDYQRYFGIPYPLKKLHLVALPEYHTGAMENWGAIVSREAFVLLDKNASTFDRRRAAYVMTHEIAHMWFGDLVTMQWWDDLWLNESFATFMEHKMLDRLYPEWDVWREFLRFETFRSMNVDGLTSTHPIQAKVKTVGEIQQVFDAISYGKGAAILRMIEDYVGQDAFRKGVSAYLRKFSYSNASGVDLWNSIARASGLPVRKVIEGWVTKPGFPVVEMTKEEGRTRLRQGRFLLTGKKAGGVWPLPLTMRSGRETKRILFDRPSMTVKARGTESLIVNPGRTGYYSVQYDEETYESLARRFSALHSHDRAAIMTDLFLFLQAGRVKPALYFKFVALCGRTAEPLVIETVTDQLATLRTIADEAPIVRRSYEDFFFPAAASVGLEPKEGEDPIMSSVRETLFSQVAKVNRGYAAELAARFSEFDSVDPNLKAAVATGYAIVNGSSAFEPLVRLLSEMGEVDRAKVYAGLTSSEEPSVVERTLELGVSGDVSRSDSVYTVVGASSNPFARRATWEWIVRRYDKLKEIYGGAQSFYLYLDRAIPRCGLGSEAEVKSFISGRRFNEGRITFRRTFETLDVFSKLRRTLLSP